MKDYPKFHKFIFDLANLGRKTLMCEFQNKKIPLKTITSLMFWHTFLILH